MKMANRPHFHIVFTTFILICRSPRRSMFLLLLIGGYLYQLFIFRPIIGK